jgi:polyisoprenyl-teichoic acid--peptidoglycan teichoic acid transferase
LTSPRKGWSWSLPKHEPRRASPARGDRHSFRKALLYTVAGTVVPGLGLILARRRVVGGIILAAFATLVLAVGLWAVTDPAGLASVAVRPAMLTGLSVALIVLALAWVAVVVATHLSLRGALSTAQRLLGGALVGVLAFAVAAPMAVAARYSYEQASLVDNVFKSQDQTKSATRPSLNARPTQPNGQPQPDPWETKPRLNILLLGGDAGRGRVGTRTDTIILASIDTKTGNTTLFSLPRNTANMPFPLTSPLRRYFPNGFTNGDSQDPERFLNSMYEAVPDTVPKDILGPTDNLGADALKLSVGEALGLKVDYYVLVNLRGFQTMVDALGGITVNVNSYVPIGGVSEEDRNVPPSDYIEPGPNQKLDGRKALWFARGRYGSDDFARMDRQRCVINAIIEQANPANLVARYERIAKAGKQLVLTDIPQEVLPLLVNLSLRVQKGETRSVLFQQGVANFRSYDPDFPAMRRLVRQALAESSRDQSAEASPSASPSDSPSPSEKKPKKSASPKAAGLEDTCAFDPEAARNATRPS